MAPGCFQPWLWWYSPWVAFSRLSLPLSPQLLVQCFTVVFLSQRRVLIFEQTVTFEGHSHIVIKFYHQCSGRVGAAIRFEEKGVFNTNFHSTSLSIQLNVGLMFIVSFVFSKQMLITRVIPIRREFISDGLPVKLNDRTALIVILSLPQA